MIDHARSLADARLQAHADRLRSRLPPSAASLGPQIARSIQWRALGDPASPGWSDRLLQATTAAVRAHRHALGGAADADVMAIAFLVLMQAAKDAREDLKAIMDQVKSINEAKRQLRELLLRLQAGTATTTGMRVAGPPWPMRRAP